MYKVIIKTSEAVRKLAPRRTDWERQLQDDFIRAIDGKEFYCDDEITLKNRFDFIAGSGFLENPSSHDYVELNSERYGKRTEPVRMWGIPQGYVSFEKVLDSVKKYGICRVQFRDFYDIRQKAHFKGCAVYIKSI